MQRKLKINRKLFAAALVISLSIVAAHANSRTLETRFALSADARSEFKTEFPVFSAGRILIEVNWNPLAPRRTPVGLAVSLVRPDGSTATSKTGISVMRLEYRASAQDIENSKTSNGARWTLRIQNDEQSNRADVSGVVRITVPLETFALEDTQFTLLGSGNAQEIPFNVPAPGRLEIQANWQQEVLAPTAEKVALVVSLIHPGESKTYARRQSASPVNVDQQVSEDALDRGTRWVVRVQNDSQSKVTGRVRINYTPSL